MLPRVRWTLLLLAGLSLAPASMPTSESSVERLLRSGQAASERGDHAAALALFQAAEADSNDPETVTFAQAATRYHLALAGGEDTGPHLVAAADLFRSQVADDNPRRSRALLGLSSSLLLRAVRFRDHSVCDEAIRRLEECVKLGEVETSAEARRLLARARLLEWQLVPTPRSAPEKSESDPGDQREPEKSPGEKKEPNKDKDPNATGPGTGTRPTLVDDPVTKPEKSKDGPQGTRAAEGDQAAVKDRDALPPLLSTEEALRQVRAATKRIQAEQKAFRRSLVRPPAEGVPDW